METLILGKTIAPLDGLNRCVLCRDPIVLADATRDGACKLCASELEELSWRTVYDREQNVGQIPANLRAAYKL
jgi:hypothetical protein